MTPLSLPEPLSFDATYRQVDGLWHGSCHSLGISEHGASLQLVRDALLAAVRAEVARLGPTHLPPGDATAAQMYAEQFAVQPFFFRQVITNRVGGVATGSGPYVEASGELKLHDSVLVVMDELGTSDRWREGFDAADLHERELLLGRARAWLTSQVGQEVESLVSYTDNVLYALPEDHADPVWTVFLAAVSAGHYQLELMRGGTLLRGGMTRGPHHSSGTLVAGSAVIRAHDLEQTHGAAPAVKLAPEVADLVRTAMSSDAGFVQPDILARVLVEDDDNYLYVDYLHSLTAFEPDDAAVSQETLRMHHSVVEQGLADNAQDAGVNSKWQWVARLHNLVVTEQGAPSELMIAETTDSLRRIT